MVSTPAHVCDRRLRPRLAGAATFAVAALAALLVSASSAHAVTLEGSFNPPAADDLVAIGFDNRTGNVFAYDDSQPVIREYTPAGAQVLPTIPLPGPAESNDVDLDFAPEGLNLNGTAVPENALLVTDDDNDNALRAIDKDDGAVLAAKTNLVPSAVDMVGGAYDAERNSHFIVDFSADRIREYDPATGALVGGPFPVHPAGSPPFDVFYGDIEVSQTTGNLLVVSSEQDRIRELTPTGAFVQDIDIAGLVGGGMAGIAIDDASGDAWIGTRSSTVSVYHLGDVTTPQPTLSIADRTVTEGDAGTINARFQVDLSATSATTVKVHYATADETATSPADYTSTSGSLSFAPGQTTKFVNVALNGDTLDEANETYGVSLSNPRFAGIADGSATGTITDDDPLPSLQITDVSRLEGNKLRFDVTLSGPSGRKVQVDYATEDGTAISPDDYTAKSGTLSFQPGVTTRAVLVNSVNDLIDEPAETLTVKLSNPRFATLADAIGQGTLLDDD